ncbi:MAG: 4Fe-4S dicluster domain-containing protein [candidate division WOR-3 bacterium]|nr:MAG: 4Fe-4S dicluster domain-containing protein [candidate division WOR-3 bacterium]
MRKPKLRELGEAIRAIFRGPYTSKFPFKPSPAAPTYRGKIEFDLEKCVLCGACVEVCPANARAQMDDITKGTRREIYYPEKCIYCGQCVSYCTTKDGIKHTPEYDLAEITKEGYEEAIEKELIFCEGCGDVITTRSHLIWIAKKVGELAYGNPNLFLVLAQEYGEESIPKSADVPPYRTEHLRYLCPKCRRSVYLHEIWGY